MQSYKKHLTSKNLSYLSGTGWGLLGFKRGLNKYQYEYDNDNYYKKPFFYTDKIGFGIMGLLIYIIPSFLPITIYKEIRRLEINLRGLEEEKDTKYYNELL